MWIHCLSVVCVGFIAFTTVQGQSTAQPNNTTNGTSNQPSVLPKLEEKGVILTAYGYSSNSFAQLRHLHAFPGIDSNVGSDSTAVAFTDSEIHFFSVDVDFRRSNLYMFDNHYGAIVIGNNYSASLNWSKMEFKLVHAVMTHSTVQVAYDWLSHTVYWTDPLFKMIVASSGEWDKADDDHFKIIAFEHLEFPDGITVDPLEGYLFWSDNGVHPKIERALLDGSARHTIKSNNLKSPMTLEADIFAKRLFWIDSWTDCVLSANYDGTDERLVIRMNRIAMLFDLAIYRDVLYVSDIRMDEMYSIDKETGVKKADAIDYKDMYETIYGLAVYSNETQPLKDKDFCAEKKCDHMCVSEKFGARCLCGEGYRFNTTTEKCDEYAGAFHKAFVFANASHICLEDFRSIMGVFSFETVCRFTMIKQNPEAPSDDAPVKRRKRQATSEPTTPANQTPPPSTAAPATTPPPSTAAPATTRPASTAAPATTRPASTAAPATTPPPSTAAPATTPPAAHPNTTMSGNQTKITPTTQAATTTPPTTTTTIPPPTVAPEDSIRMIEVDAKDRWVFFVTQNNRIFKRSLDLPIENDRKEEMAEGTSEITDLAYDPEDRNLYWSQSDGHIYLINIGSTEVERLTTDSQLVSPHDLVVLIHQRKLAFIAGDLNMTIYTMDFDGTNINSPLENYGNMSSLIYDKETDLLYFLVTGEGKIYSVPLDGSEEPTLVTLLPDPNTYMLMEYNGYFIWVYSSEEYPNVLMSVRKSSPYTTVGHYVYDNVSSIVDVKILDPDRQATPPGLCSKDNGGCEQICISKLVNGNPRKVCECKKGFMVADNEMNCTSSPEYNNFFVFVDWTNDEVLQYGLDSGELHAIPTQDNYLYMSIFLDPDTLRVYWSSYFDSHLYSSKLDGSDTSILADFGYAFPYKFEKDSSTGNLYYFSYYYQEIGLVTPSGVKLKLIGNFMYDRLKALAVHPRTGHLYYAVHTYKSAYIARADMDGQNAKTIMKDGPLKRPEGIVLDYIHDHLYIGDYEEDTILQCDLDGENCLTIVNTTGNNIMDMDTDGTSIFYTTYSKDYIVKVELVPPYRDEIIAQVDGLGIVNTISYYSSSNKNIQPVDNACKENNGLGDCSMICIPIPYGRTCACADDIDLHPDGRTCENEHLCKDVIVHTNPDNNETIEISFSASCFRREDSTCEYKCPSNYVSVDKTNTKLTCELDGWDRETHVLCRALQCADTFENGVIDESCSKKIGSVCDFTCDEGFVKGKTELYCKEDEMWHGQSDDICSPYKCDDSVPNGKLDTSCARTVGSKCSFTCDKYYDFATTKKVSKITCGPNGWNLDTSVLCQDAKCDERSLMNGMVATGCVNHVGQSCQYKCDDLFTNSTNEVVCRFDQKWHPKEACKTLYCPQKVENGTVDIKCSPKVNSVCRYYCDESFTPLIKRGNITCLPSGQWNASRDLCQVAPVTEPLSRVKPESVSTGLIAVLVVLGIIFLALSVVVLLLYKRRRASASFATSSFKNEDDVAIENPVYGKTFMTGIELNDDRPYSGDENQSTEQTADRGKANPSYDNVTLGERK